MQLEKKTRSIYPDFELEYSTLLSDLKVKLDDSRAFLNMVLDGEVSYQNTLVPWIERQDELSRFWSIISHLNSVKGDPKLNQLFPEALRLLTTFQTEISQNQSLYQAMKTILKEDLSLTKDQKKWLMMECRDFELAGVGLEAEQQKEFAALVNQGSQLSEQFEQNVLIVTDEWHLNVKEAQQLQGLPEDLLEASRQLAESRGEQGYTLTLQAHCFIAVMKYVKDMSIRRQMYSAYVSRAATRNGAHDNGPNITKILDIRHRQATLLGFPHFADYSLADKMAVSVGKVEHFLQTLAERARPLAESEWQSLKAFAKEQGVHHIQPWDVSLLSERQRQKLHDIDGNMVRSYFQLPRVLSGLMHVVQRVFNMRFSEVAIGVKTWHPSVQIFSLIDGEGQPRGTIFFDLYARSGKRGGAWMDVCQQRAIFPEGNVRLPMAFVTCNFSPPAMGRPALLTHADVLTLFHEMGHALHHVFSEVDVPGLSGVAGVPWDVVEYPSQLLEHWAWQPEVLKQLSCHVDHGEPLSDEWIERLIKARHFQAGLSIMRQVSYALFDLTIHQSPRAMDASSVQATLNHIRQRYWLTPVADFDRFQNAFTHIFSGGYAAGYYSYLWAELLSSDIFSRFEEEGIWSTQVGSDLLEHLLSRGGACDVLSGFKAFRGREPNLDALCRHLGLHA